MEWPGQCVSQHGVGASLPREEHHGLIGLLLIILYTRRIPRTCQSNSYSISDVYIYFHLSIVPLESVGEYEVLGMVFTTGRVFAEPAKPRPKQQEAYRQRSLGRDTRPSSQPRGYGPVAWS